MATGSDAGRSNSALSLSKGSLREYLGRGDWLRAARRWAQLRGQHERTKAMVARGESPDTPSRQLAAARRTLDLAPTVAAETGAARALGMGEWLGSRGQERIIGRPDFEQGAFLELGLAVGRAVCMVELKDRLSGALLRGTGFLVAPGVVLTNHHVLMSQKEALGATVTFDYRNDPYGNPLPVTAFSLDPGALFESSAEYDCTIVGVGRRLSGNFDVQAFGWLPLVGAEGKVEVGDPINIVQHPRGEPMQWVVRNNRLLYLPELQGERDEKVYAHYEADTMPGSSGAPAMSRLWEVFALHHQAVPDVDEAGNVLDLDGNPYAGDDDSRVRWLGNEGIRVSALVRFLEARRRGATGSSARLLDAVLSASRPDYIALAVASRGPGQSGGAAADLQEGPSMPGRIEFVLPLKVSISLGDVFLGSGQVVPIQQTGSTQDLQVRHDRSDVAALAVTPRLTPELRKQREEALEELGRSRTRPYLDAEKIRTDSAAYYQGLNLGPDGAANFEALSQLVTTTHATKPRYAPSKQLYPWIDLYKDGRRLAIKSIYSGAVFDAQDFIEAAFDIEARREALRATFRTNEALRGASEALLEDLLEDTAPYNCEHSVPQSWFQKEEPMRGDMHHLFACETRCNSFRGNHAYFDFPDTEATMEACGRREEDQFEPIMGKGAVARATLYFLARYPGRIDLDISQMDADRVETLKRWHEGDRVSDYERHRNQGIFEVQGNRNPFVDHPEWVARVDFDAGLAL